MKQQRKSNKEAYLLDAQQKVTEKFGEQLKVLRLKKGYTSYEIFAYEHGIDRSQYGKYERGADIRLTTLVKILGALDISFAEFFSDWK